MKERWKREMNILQREREEQSAREMGRGRKWEREIDCEREKKLRIHREWTEYRERDGKRDMEWEIER